MNDILESETVEVRSQWILLKVLELKKIKTINLVNPEFYIQRKYTSRNEGKIKMFLFK